MTLGANTPERDAAIRDLAAKFSQTAGRQPLDISVAAAALFIVAQADHADCASFNAYVAKQLRRVGDLYTDGEIKRFSEANPTA